MTIQQVAVFGGAGYLGQALLVAGRDAGLAMTSVDRRPIPTSQQVVGVRYVTADITVTPVDVAPYAWVIDCIGILSEHPRQGITYANSIIEPATRIIDAVAQTETTQFVFISALTAPLWLRRYLQAKRQVEVAAQQRLGVRAHIIRPGLIIDPSRPLMISSCEKQHLNHKFT